MYILWYDEIACKHGATVRYQELIEDKDQDLKDVMYCLEAVRWRIAPSCLE